MDSIETQNREIIDAAYVDVYTPGMLTKMVHPYILGNAERPSPKMADMSDIYIIDSAIGKDDITNEDVAYEGERLDADAVVPKDFIDEPGRALSSAEELGDMVDIPMIVPIHGGAEGHGYWASEAYDLFGDDVWAYGVGGVKDRSPTEQLEAVTQVRETLGDGVDIHLFGAGMSKEWIATIRERPDLIDSLDLSTPERAQMQGDVVHADMGRVGIGNIRGKKSTIRRARMIELSILNFCYVISPLSRDEDVNELMERREA